MNASLSTPLILHVAPHEYRDQLSIVFSDDRDIVWTVGSGNLKAEVGMSTDGSWGANNPLVILGWWTTFPVKAYARGTAQLDGYVSRSHSGKTCSIPGEFQGTRKLAVTFDRRLDTGLTDIPRYEYTAWRKIWRGRWNVGRSVSFWLALPAFVRQTAEDVGGFDFCATLTWGDSPGQLGKFEQLIIVPENNVWRPSRIVEMREFADTETAENTFYLRPKRRRNNTGVTDLYWVP
jgi:hypothetical protein